ncbi:unnamed protein product [Arctogadus glacialis]
MILFWSFDVYECTLYINLSGFIARCYIIHMFIPHSFFYFLQLANMAKQKLGSIPVCSPSNDVKNKNQKKQRPITYPKLCFLHMLILNPFSLFFSTVFSRPYRACSGKAFEYAYRDFNLTLTRLGCESKPNSHNPPELLITIDNRH